MTAPIEVLEVKPITGHGYLRAFAKVLGTVHPRLSSWTSH
jgi:hypothetical protein